MRQKDAPILRREQRPQNHTVRVAQLPADPADAVRGQHGFPEECVLAVGVGILLSFLLLVGRPVAVRLEAIAVHVVHVQVPWAKPARVGPQE